MFNFDFTSIVLFCSENFLFNKISFLSTKNTASGMKEHIFMAKSEDICRPFCLFSKVWGRGNVSMLVEIMT